MRPYTLYASALLACGLLLTQVSAGPGAAVRQRTTWPQTLRNSLGMEFVLIPAGTFVMGSSQEEIRQVVRQYSYNLKREWLWDEMPQRRVRISQPFYLGKYEVTQAQWQAVMGNNPSRFQGQKRPVESVSWKDVQVFIRRLNARESGVTYRLPTEAEWEYAARGRDGRPYPWGRTFDASRLNFCDRNCTYLWKDRAANDGYGDTAPVGSYAGGISPFGVHDMLGNVWEWVQDRYEAYTPETVTDPQGAATGGFRVMRGGSWDNNPGLCRVAARLHVAPHHRFDFLGFRLVRTTP